MFILQEINLGVCWKPLTLETGIADPKNGGRWSPNRPTNHPEVHMVSVKGYFAKAYLSNISGTPNETSR